MRGLHPGQTIYIGLEGGLDATPHLLPGVVSTTYTLLLCETVHTCILSEIAFRPTFSETRSIIPELNSEFISDPYVWHRLGEDPTRMRPRDGDEASPDEVLSLSDVSLPAGRTGVRREPVVVGASALKGGMCSSIHITGPRPIQFFLFAVYSF